MTLSCLKRADKSRREESHPPSRGCFCGFPLHALILVTIWHSLGIFTRFGCDLGVISINHENLCLGTVYRDEDEKPAGLKFMSFQHLGESMLSSRLYHSAKLPASYPAKFAFSLNTYRISEGLV